MQTVKLSDVCTIVSGSTPKTDEPAFWNGTLKWVTPAELRDDTVFVTDTERHITEAAARSAHLTPFPAGTVLLSSRAPIGKTAIAGAEMYCNQGFKNLICSDRIDNRYLYYFLSSRKVYLNDLGRGATFKEISKAIVENIEIPLPPIAEQQRIVRELRQVDALLANRRQTDSLLAKLPKARFVEMFGDPVLNPMGAPVKTISDLCSKIVDCPHSTPQEYVASSNYPAIRTSEIKDGRIDWTTMRFVTQHEYEKRTKRLIPQAGDVVYGREGSFGDAVILPEKFRFCLGQRVMLLRANPDVCVPEFLWQTLKSPYVFMQAKQKNVGATVGHVNVSDIVNFTTLIPPLPAQRRFAAFARACAAQRAACARQIAVLETLRGKLLQDAFGAAG